MRILYLMHINWFWIRQRPQVFAGLLAERHTVHLLHYAMYRREHSADELPPPMPHGLLHRVPGPIKRQSDLFEALDGALIRAQIAWCVQRFRPDCLWVLHPVFEPATRGLPHLRVVYDCMDDHMEFAGQGTPRLLDAERRLAERADLCLFSSHTLASRVAQRATYGSSMVVNNGVSERFLETARQPEPCKAGEQPAPDTFRLGYFGTISSWFDWDLVFQLLDQFPKLVVRLAGPIDGAIPEHPRIQHAGILSHQQLAAFAAECVALFMPFKVNRLIESVDPIKLYEYLALGLPALAPLYPESLRFAPFVQLYGNHAEALATMEAIILGRILQPEPAAVRDFLLHNTWEARLDMIDDALRTMDHPICAGA